MTRCALAALLAMLTFWTPGRLAAALPPSGAAVDAAVEYARAVGSGNYAKSYGMLTATMQRYFGSLRNYESVFTAERFSAIGPSAVRVRAVKNAQIVTLRESIQYLNHGTQQLGHGRLELRYRIVREGKAYRVDDEGHPYRSYVPSGTAAIERNGVKVIVRELAFYPRRIELALTFENDGNAFITFLPYGRTLLREGSNVYHPLDTRNWLLTDRALFLGLRLAPNARYTGQIDFLTPGRLDDRARAYDLTIAPALPEGADQPIDFVLPSIAVPAP
ncbi:MAG: hypothetical protein ABSE64_13425 [Vulcanimicrobiaceae bacterium]|jgi:hypothetical protein